MKTDFNKVCVVGLGYIGLPTASIIASRGVQVVGLDVNAQIVETLNEGNTHIVEPELDAMFHGVVSTGNFRATLTPEEADVFLIAVPTPLTDNFEPDTRYIQAAARSIAPVLRKGNLVILESTSPVGTTEKMVALLSACRRDLHFPDSTQDGTADIQVAYCPERVLPGHVLRELLENDRVIGGITPYCAERAISFYQLFVEGQCIPTNARTAEMAKLVENSFRDVNIAFANELSMICDSLNMNVWELIALANHHPRVNILQPGPGVGGHCIAVDPWFIVHAAPELSPLIRSARNVNDHKPQWVVNKVKEAANRFKQPVIACLGLAFKPNIDDFRESPALRITLQLAQEIEGQIIVIEPFVNSLPSVFSEVDNVALMNGMDADAIGMADIVVFLVNHRSFETIAPALLEGKVLVDTCGMWR